MSGFPIVPPIAKEWGRIRTGCVTRMRACGDTSRPAQPAETYDKRPR